jgi:formyl-CoA transferase
MTPFLEAADQQLSFPPRFGEHNREIYGRLGYSNEALDTMQENGVI